jgi:dynein light intermediate chain 1
VTKPVWVLGAPQSGKSSLIEYFQQGGIHITEPKANPRVKDLALSYSYSNIQDEFNEETITRLGYYQLASTKATAMQWIQLPPERLAETLVLVVLDWSTPWLWLEQIQDWVQAIDTMITRLISSQSPPETSQANPSAEVLKQMKSRVQAHFQEYMEPDLIPEGRQDHETKNVMHSSLASDVVLPLGPGTLTHNLGLPLVFVCTKADHIAQLSHEGSYREETFDYIQQTLRTIALHYGAAVFYTSISKPTTLSLLKEYIQFRQSPPLTHLGSPAVFPHRAHVTDRDTLFIPSGWDSRGKIAILNEKLDLDKAVWNKEAYRDHVPVPMGLSFLGSNGVHPHLAKILNSTTTELEMAVPEQTFLEEKFTLLKGQSDSGGVGAGSKSSVHEEKGARFSPLAPGKVPALSPTTPVGADQSAVLANFFQSLLNNRGPGAGSGPNAGAAGPQSRRSTSGTTEGQTGVAVAGNRSRHSSHLSPSANPSTTNAQPASQSGSP